MPSYQDIARVQHQAWIDSKEGDIASFERADQVKVERITTHTDFVELEITYSPTGARAIYSLRAAGSITLLAN